MFIVTFDATQRSPATHSAYIHRSDKGRTCGMYDCDESATRNATEHTLGLAEVAHFPKLLTKYFQHLAFLAFGVPFDQWQLAFSSKSTQYLFFD